MKCFMLLLFTTCLAFVVCESDKPLSSSEIFEELRQKYQLRLPEDGGDFDEPERVVSHRQRNDGDFDEPRNVKVNKQQERQENGGGFGGSSRFQNGRGRDFDEPREDFRQNRPVVEEDEFESPKETFRPRPPVKEFNVERQLNQGNTGNRKQNDNLEVGRKFVDNFHNSEKQFVNFGNNRKLIDSFEDNRKEIVNFQNNFDNRKPADNFETKRKEVENFQINRKPFDNIQNNRQPSKIDNFQNNRQPSKIENFQNNRQPSKIDNFQNNRQPSKIDNFQNNRQPSKLDTPLRPNQRLPPFDGRDSRPEFRQSQSSEKIIDDRPNLPSAQPQPRQVPRAPVPAILKQINEINDDGSYTFGYESEDGTYRVETRGLDGITRGKYGYLDASGMLREVEYSAGGGIGYEPSGDEIDVPPPYTPSPREREDEEREERERQVEQRSRTTRPRPSGRFEAEEEEQRFLNERNNRNRQQQQRSQEKPRSSQKSRFRDDGDEIFSLAVDYEK